MARRFVAIACAGIAGACSSVPDVEYSYYLAKWTGTLMVTQTVDCNAAKTDFVYAYSVQPTMSYTSDYSKDPVHVRIKGIEGAFAPFVDSDMSMTLTPDGRLQSINQSTTGQGETVIKAAASVVTALAPLGAGKPGAKSVLPDCAVIASKGSGKPLTIVYSQDFNPLLATGASRPLHPAQASADLLAALPHLPPLEVEFDKPQPVKSGARYIPGSVGQDMIAVTLQQMEVVDIAVATKTTGQRAWTGSVIVPGSETYSLPIPKAALFGGQSLKLTIADSGAITTVDYGKTSGAAGALNAANSAITAESPSAASRAAVIKGQADVIAQQTRLMKCQSAPATCQ